MEITLMMIVVDRNNTAYRCTQQHIAESEKKSSEKFAHETPSIARSLPVSINSKTHHIHEDDSRVIGDVSAGLCCTACDRHHHIFHC